MRRLCRNTERREIAGRRLERRRSVNVHVLIRGDLIFCPPLKDYREGNDSGGGLGAEWLERSVNSADGIVVAPACYGPDMMKA